MIYQGSRYQNSTVVTVHGRSGATPIVLRRIPSGGAYSEIAIGEYDNLQTVAARAYGDAELWWVIADANPQILYPDRIPAGTVLRVPVVQSLS